MHGIIEQFTFHKSLVINYALFSRQIIDGSTKYKQKHPFLMLFLLISIKKIIEFLLKDAKITQFCNRNDDAI